MADTATDIATIERLTELGGQWDAEPKVWLVPKEREAALMASLASLGRGVKVETSRAD